MAARIATVTGTALVPGVSKNRRLYTKQAIAKAVERAQQRIADGELPLTMLTHHEAGDDSTRIIGRIRSLTLADDGSARFEADVADTQHGRDIANLIDPNGDTPPYLKGVSIRGAWAGEVRQQPGPDGQPVETSDDLELDGLDYTRKPGVAGAQVDTVTWEATETASGRPCITESVQEAVVALVAEATPKANTPAPAGSYADPGYQKDKKPRYPLDTKAHAKAAWAYIGKPENANLYTAAQLKRIKGRISKALKKFGVTVAAQEGWLIDAPTAITEGELYGAATTSGGYRVSLTNGPTTVSVDAYGLDPHDLQAIGRAAMDGACQALAAIDPDMDGDIDVPGAPGEDTDTDGLETIPAVAEDDDESDDTEDGPEPGSACDCGCGCAVPASDTATCPCDCTECDGCMPGKADTETDDNQMETTEETAMAEPTTTTESAAPAAAAPSITLTPEQFEQLLARTAPAVAPVAAPAVEAAPVAAAPVAETVQETEDQRIARLVAEQVAAAMAPAPVVQETEEQRIARLVAEGVAAAMPGAVQEHVLRQGPPARKGLVTEHRGETAGAGEQGAPAEWPDKPLHQFTAEERRDHFGPALEQFVLGSRAQL